MALAFLLRAVARFYLILVVAFHIFVLILLYFSADSGQAIGKCRQEDSPEVISYHGNRSDPLKTCSGRILGVCDWSLWKFRSGCAHFVGRASWGLKRGVPLYNLGGVPLVTAEL